eukprot:gene16865-biopygen21835
MVRKVPPPPGGSSRGGEGGSAAAGPAPAVGRNGSGRVPHGRIQRDGRVPGASSAVSPIRGPADRAGARAARRAAVAADGRRRGRARDVCTFWRWSAPGGAGHWRGQWRWRGAGCKPFSALGGAGVARAWPVPPSLRYTGGRGDLHNRVQVRGLTDGFSGDRWDASFNGACPAPGHRPRAAQL